MLKNNVNINKETSDQKSLEFNLKFEFQNYSQQLQAPKDHAIISKI